MSDDIQGRFVSSLYQHIQRFCREYRSGARNNCTVFSEKNPTIRAQGGRRFLVALGESDFGRGPLLTCGRRGRSVTLSSRFP